MNEKTITHTVTRWCKRTKSFITTTTVFRDNKPIEEHVVISTKDTK